MNRKISCLVVAALFLMAALAGTAASAGKPVPPKVGWYEGGTSQHSGFLRSGVRTIKRGGQLTVGLDIGIEVKCPSPAVMTLNTAKTTVGKSPGALGAPPRLRKNSTFSLVRTVPYNVGGSMRVKIYGKFQSATKVTGTILLSKMKDPELPETDCTGVEKITFTAYYLTRKPVTPQFGLYYGRVVGAPANGEVKVLETELKVVKIGKHRRGAQLRVSPFAATCTEDFKGGPWGVSVLEKTPIPIKGGRFTLDRTYHNVRVAGGAGTATTRVVVFGVFKSATKVVVRVYVSSFASVQFPEQPEVKGTCTGEQTSTAKRV